MKKLVTSIFLSVMMLSFVSCTSTQREEIKTVTAKGLSEGLSNVLLTEVLKCDNEQAVKFYVENKVCGALKADCGYDNKMSFSAKGVVAKYACKMSVKIAMPAILPSQQMPIELKAAGCKSDSLDDLATTMVSKLCDKL